MSKADPTRCGIVVAGVGCGRPVDPQLSLNLCALHLLEAYDEVAQQVGVTDLLPSPCIACGSRLGVRYPSGWSCAICEWRVGDLPDADAVTTRVDVVYYIRFKDRIKIGTSANPRGRLAQLPYDELLAFERGDRRREQRRHAEFARYRVPGTEWFELHDALVEHVGELRVGVDDPWDQYHLWQSQAIALGR